MPATRPPKPRRARLVHIIPIEGVYIPGVPHREQDVTEAEWLEISRYKPPAFVRRPDSTPKEGKD